MTLSLKKGSENVLDALKYYLSGELPAVITARNAQTSATLTAYYKGPYTYDGSKKISITRNGASSPVEYTPSSASHTASALVTLLNADGTFSANLTATTALNGNYLQIYEKTRGTAGSLKVEDETGNTVLGWQSGYTDNYYPLRDFAQIEWDFVNIEPLAYPAIKLQCVSIDPDAVLPSMRYYNINMRVYEVAQDPSATQSLMTNLARYQLLLTDLLTPLSGARNLDLQINTISLPNLHSVNELEVSAGPIFRAYIDFDFTVQVQED